MPSLTPASVFRRYVTAGVPSSGNHEPNKDEIVQLLNLLFGTSRGGWVVAGTKSELDGVTPENETDGGVVLNDSTASNNGYYQRDASAWVRERGFPDTFARVTLGGTANAQTGAVSSGVNPGDIEVFIAFATTANTGAMTLSIGGETARDVVNAAGNALSAGEWTGVVLFVLNDDGDYQLIIDAGAAASAAQSASEAAASAAAAAVSEGNAEDAANRAETAAAGVEYPVSYGAAQSLTEPQRMQARQNIGVATETARPLTDWVMPDGATDNTADLITALAATKHLIIPKTTSNWQFAGTFPIPSDTIIEFVGTPVIDMVVNGDERGFHFAQGTTNSHIRGDAVINHTRDSYVNPNGDYGGCFTFSNFVYGTDTPLAVQNCSIVGDILIRCLGAQNSKPVNIYGWTEDVQIEGIRATGMTNYAIVGHWTGNHADTSTAPTMTWHPHNITVRRCRIFREDGLAQVIRAFTWSACGRVTMEDCEVEDFSSLAWNLFCGDYGPQFAQNITEDEAYQYTIRRSRSRGSSNHMSVDMQTNAVNGAPRWTRGKSRIIVDDLTLEMVATSAISANCIACSFPDVLDVRNLQIIEEGAGNDEYVIELFGVRQAHLEGQVFSRHGVLYRDCGEVYHGLKMKASAPGVTGTYAITVSATHTTATTVGNMVVGREGIIIDDSSLVASAGGLIQYTLSGKLYESQILTTTYANDGQQEPAVDPLMAYIPTGTTVTIIQTVKKLTVGPVTLDGYGASILLTGNATAKPRNITVDQATLKNSYAYDIDAQAVDGLTVNGVQITDSARRGDGLSNHSINLRADVENFIIIGNHWDATCWRVRYGVCVKDGASKGFIDGNIFEAISATAINAACIFKDKAANVTLGTQINTSGEPTSYS